MSGHGELLDIVGAKHKAVYRDYISRVTDPIYPKAKAAELAKKWDFEYWDGDRRINYGGYYYRPGYWTPVAEALIDRYELNASSRVLDVGCGKGFLLAEMRHLIPGITVLGVDISGYAIANSHPSVTDYLFRSSATELPWDDQSFDLVISINTLHNFHCFDLESALLELERVALNKFVVVESYRTESEKANLIYWQVTCEAFCTPEEWVWWFNHCNYSGDFEFIYFD
jgi:protein-L-isoaspartate(D-aspartate) O-methyltransferase